MQALVTRYPILHMILGNVAENLAWPHQSPKPYDIREAYCQLIISALQAGADEHADWDGITPLACLAAEDHFWGKDLGSKILLWWDALHGAGFNL